MKILSVIFFLLFFMADIVNCQTINPSWRQFNDSVSDKSFRESRSLKRSDRKSLNDNEAFKLPEAGRINKHYRQWPGINSYQYDSITEERFPGSEKFYARRPELVRPFDKSFIIPPVSTLGRKYYLIIKDPVSQRIMK